MLGIDIEYQVRMSMFASFIGCTVLLLEHFSLMFLLWMFVVQSLVIMASVPGAFVLYVLHKFFDMEGLTRQDRDYSYGHYAWSVLICIFTVTYLGTTDYVNKAYMVVGVSNIPVIYFVFCERREGNRNKRKKKVSERLKALIEKCKSWLNKPQLKPVNQRSS